MEARTKVILKVHVAYPKELLETWQSQAVGRRNGGELSSTVCFDPKQQNFVYFILEWDSLVSAERFWASVDGSRLIAAWHAVRKPDFLMLEEYDENRKPGGS